MSIRPAYDPLNSQAKSLEDTETEIRLLVQAEFFKKTPQREIGRKVDKLHSRRGSMRRTGGRLHGVST